MCCTASWMVGLAVAGRIMHGREQILQPPLAPVHFGGGIGEHLGGEVCGSSCLCYRMSSSVTPFLGKKFVFLQRRGKGIKDLKKSFVNSLFFTSKVQKMLVTFLRESLCLKQWKNPLWHTENFVTLDLCLMNNFCHYHLFSEILTLTLFRHNTRKLSPGRPNVIMLVRETEENFMPLT